MNQRNFSWDNENTRIFVNDLLKIFIEDKYPFRLGSFIALNYEGDKDIYDGQQRIICCFLILKAMIKTIKRMKQTPLTEAMINKIYKIIALDELEQHDDKYNVTKKAYRTFCKINEEPVVQLPKITCTYPDDNIALISILNDSYTPWFDFIDIKKYISNYVKVNEVDEEDITFTCSLCGEDHKLNKGGFKRHLKSHIEIVDTQCITNSKIYDTYVEIYKWITLKQFSEQSMLKFLNFMQNDIEINLVQTKDPEYVSKIFTWENHRGKSVERHDVIKNPIITRIPDQFKSEIFKEWEVLKKIEDQDKDEEKSDSYKYKYRTIYTTYGKKLFRVAIMIYNQKVYLNQISDEIQEYRNIIEAENTYIEIKKFFGIVKDLDNIMYKIAEDRLGRLILNAKSAKLDWEAYSLLLLPIFYFYGYEKEYVSMFVKYCFRNIGITTKGINVDIQKKLVEITNEFIEQPDKSKITDLRLSISNLIDEINNQYGSEKRYIESVKDIEYKKGEKSRFICLFIETIGNNKSMPLFSSTVEHIYSVSRRHELQTNSNHVYRVGNFTLLEGTNTSTTKHKGNSSIGNMDFKDKHASYSKSDFRMTRDLAKKYRANNGFQLKHITKRTKELLRIIYKSTTI